MKFRALLFIISIFFYKISLSQKGDTLYAEISFTKISIDTSTIKVSSSSLFKYYFQNTGNKPLTIRYAESVCSCIVPSWTKETILPGAWGYVDCLYDPVGHLGNFNKQVMVYSNARNGTVTLNMKGYIIK